MKDNKIKISNILSSLIPDFIETDNTALDGNSLFKQFLTQYYAFEERQYGTTDIAENIQFNKKISTLSEMETVRAQTIPEDGTTVPSEQIRLNGEVYAYDDYINVNHTKGFPNTYGLLKIDDEIVTYTSKTDTSFLGCVRGFSGISKIETTGNPEFLTFSITEAKSHLDNSIVTNLGFVFLEKFYTKFKTNYLPGLEKRTVAQGVSVENILSRAKDFYTSKGTDLSLDILFKVLFGKQVIINKPFDNTILPSSAKWIRGKQITVETISGNPSDLKFSTLYQGNSTNFSTNSTAKAAIQNVQEVFLHGKKRYYKLFLSPDTIVGDFIINSKTKVIATSSSNKVVTVDSTVGFGETGSFYYKDSNGNYISTKYGSKSYNQFFDCEGLSNPLTRNTEIIDDNFVFSYEDNDPDKICQMRVVGSISDVSGNFNDTKYFNVGDELTVKYFGEKTLNDNKIYNSWIYNNVYQVNILSIVESSKTIKTGSEHYLRSGDFISIKDSSGSITLDGNAEVDDIIDTTTFTIKGSGNNSNFAQSPNPSLRYYFERILKTVPSSLGFDNVLSDIQNSFVDDEKNTYIAFSGYPSYDNIQTSDRSKEFTSVGVGTTATGITFIDDDGTLIKHGFIQGEKVYFEPIANQQIGPGITTTDSAIVLGYFDRVGKLNDKTGIVGINTGVYYVDVIDDNSIKLALTGYSIFDERNLWNYDVNDDGFTLFPTSVLDDDGNTINPKFKYKITPYELHEGELLKNQNNFRKIPLNPELAKTHNDISGPIGVSVDGLEIYSPISKSFVHYGQLEKIDIINPGSNYDIVNPPNVSVADTTGSSIECNVHLNEGSVEDVLLTSRGWDFNKIPSVTITGGNGRDVNCDANLKNYTHSQTFSEFQVGTATTIGVIGIGTYHRFDDGEEVIYTVSNPGTAVGVGSTHADVSGIASASSPEQLINGGIYYVSRTNDDTFSLAVTKERALNKTLLLDFTDDGAGTHTLTSTRKRKIIERISIHNRGNSFANNKVDVDATKYPPTLQSEVTTTFVGINTYNDYIYAKNHNFKEGDVIEYSCSGFDNRIVGLNTITQYKVNKVSNDKFKLADIGPDKDANYALGSKFERTNRLASHTYVDGATSWQQVDGAGDSGYVGIMLRNLRVGEKYRISIKIDNNATLDLPISYMHRVHSNITNGARTDFTHWNDDGTGTAPTGLLTGEFIAQSENLDEFLFYCEQITVNVSDFKVELIENNYKDYERKIYSSLISIGSGTHTFNYPDIKLTIEGVNAIGITTDTLPDYYYAKADPVVRGKVDNLFIKSGGVGYGVSTIVNVIREPDIKLDTGSGAIVEVIIDFSGKIVKSNVVSGGSKYSSPPSLKVVGNGYFAQLKANVSDGKIISVDILNGGTDYDNTTTVEVIATGGESINKQNALFQPHIHKWYINEVHRFSDELNYKNDTINENKDTLQIRSESLNKGNKLITFYPNRQLRKNFDDNINENDMEKTEELVHSPILGWAYDGNPIYGPYGYKNAIPTDSGFGEVQKMVSGYTKKSENSVSSGLRPESYEQGFFIEDYEYTGDGDLDEYNGRYEINDDYPNGVYAYYFTLGGSPIYPYVTFKHHNQTDEFNYDIFMDQSDKFINNGNYRRNVTFLGMNEDNKSYPFLDDQLKSNVNLRVESVKSAGITTITALDRGDNYNVNDIISLSDNTVANARVSEILGKDILSIETSTTTISNLKFSVQDKKVVAIGTSPHGLKDGDIVSISGISSSIYSHISGTRIIGVSTVATTLSIGIGNTNTTGLTTFISLGESTLSDRFVENDIIKINNEHLRILNKDHINNRYRVARISGGDPLEGIAHSAGLVVEKLPIEFTFDVDSRVFDSNLNFSKKYNFNGAESVGIGTTFSRVVVAGAGSSNIIKSIPPGGIYLPGHGFETGDRLSYVAVGSTMLYSRTTDLFLSNSEELDVVDIPTIYAIKFSDEFIGIATEVYDIKPGSSPEEYYGLPDNFVYFKSATSHDHRFESIVTEVGGIANKIDANIVLKSDHSLLVDDKIKLNITPRLKQDYVFTYNSEINNLVLNSKEFANTSVLTSNSSFSITEHGFNTGDSVIFTTSNTAPAPLVNNKIYYAIKTTDNNIKLADSYYNATKYPYSEINLTTTGSGNHQIGNVSLFLQFYKGNTIEIDTSHSSLNGYDINFYYDKEFQSPYNTTLIKKVGIMGDGESTTKITINVTDDLLSGIYYRLEGNLSLTNDSRNDIDSRINIINSEFNKIHRISGVGSTTLTLNLVGAAETTSYTSSGFSTVFYTTDSTNDSGSIYSIIANNLISTDNMVKVTSIASTSGVDAIFTEESDEIGQILGVDVINQGFEFPTDKTLTPKADSYVILKLKDIYTLDSIGVTTGGRNYTTPPRVVAIGNDNINTKSILSGNSVYDVEIISNDSGLSKNLEIISTINSNGIGVIDATSNASERTNTLELNAPITGWLTGEFPFAIGDVVYIEGVDIVGGASSTADGYNSSDYDNKHFTLIGVNTTGGSLGNGTIKYSIAGIGSIGGAFDPENVFGRVVKVDDLARFKPHLTKIEFIEGETIRQEGTNASGIIVARGWNNNSQLLKLKNVQGEFIKDKKIFGSISNLKSIVQENYEFDFNLKVDSLVSKSIDWETDIGILNSDMQKLHDNDYYQRFSYAVKGEIPYQDWKEPIESMGHISGYKPFSDLEILNGKGTNVGMSSLPSDLIINVKVLSDGSVHERYNYDLVSENTSKSDYSKIITFDSKIITDYSESRTNKVLLIDDISSQFTGSNVTFTGTHIFVRDELFNSTGAVNIVGGGDLKVNTSGTSYDPSTGILTLTTSTNHNLSVGDEITLRDNSLTFTCSKDNHETEHPYPRSTDPASTSNVKFNNGILKVIEVVDTDTFTILVNNPSIGGQTVGLSTFTLFTVDKLNTIPTGISTSRLFYKTLKPSEGVDLDNNFIIIKDHEFNTAEELRYSPNGFTPLQVDDLSGGTTNMPSIVYAINPGTSEDRDRDKFQVASTIANANAGTALTVTSVGTGNTHTFAIPTELATNRTVISIDNIVQNPISFNKQVNLSLDRLVGVGSTAIWLNDISKISGGDIVKIEDEYMKVTGVGIGSTSILYVNRGSLGTSAAAHAVGAAITSISGDYRIENGIIHFTTPPYGPSASKFNGRAFYRRDYSRNYTFDDISESFDGESKEFLLKQNGIGVTNLDATREYGMMMVNNIFQDPEHGFGASNLSSSDYTIVGSGSSILFSGTYVGTQNYASDTRNYPKGGIINEFIIDPGVGIQSSFQAIISGYNINSDGEIASVSIGNSGSGYLQAPSVGIAITNYHFDHRFVTSIENSITVTGGAKGPYTPTDAVYNSTTGNLTLTIPNHTLTTSDTISFVNESLVFQCSKDGYSSDHAYPRTTDPASTSNSKLNTGVLVIDQATIGVDIVVNVGRAAGIGATLTATIDNGMVTGITVVNGGTGYKDSYAPTITISEPAPWMNIPLIGGNGSGATLDVVIGTGMSAISYNLSNPGIGYYVSDELEMSPVPYNNTGISTSPLKLTVKNRHQDKFSGWTFGQLLEIDNFGIYFNGFRRTFLLTRTTTTKDYYSINSREGAGIVLANNLLIFINDVLQQPVEDYTFIGGTKITFKEAPKKGSKLKVYLYVASSDDYLGVEIDETIKPGDGLSIQKWLNDGVYTIPQDERIVYELISSDSVNTQTYTGVGIRTDDLKRPVMWKKQTEDKIIDGIRVGKTRVQLEPQIYPSTNIIKSVSPTDTKIYVKNPYPLFSVYDDISQNLNNVTIVGLGATPLDTSSIETVKSVSYGGDYGQITGISTAKTGVGTHQLIFDISCDPNIKSSVTREGSESNLGNRPGIGTGDYFVIENTGIGSVSLMADGGVKSLGIDASTTVGIGSTWIDGVYQALTWTETGVGNTSIRVTTYVSSLAGIHTLAYAAPVGGNSARDVGTYSWGYLTGNRSSTAAKSFTFYNENGIAGIETSAHISRKLQLKDRANPI